MEYIRHSIEKKLSKTYSVGSVNLCVLCLFDLTFWVLDHYGSVLQLASDSNRQDLLSWIRFNCIKARKFRNVFLVFPDIAAKWWVWDVKTGIRSYVWLPDKVILNREAPYWLVGSVYEGLINQK